MCGRCASRYPERVPDYLVLFGTAFAAATLLPLPSEAALVLVVRRHDEMWWPVLVATLGNCLGAATTYVMFRLALRRALDSPGSRWTRAAALINRFGAPALLLSWVPIIGDAIVAVAGAARMPIIAFVPWMAGGKVLRYIVVAALAGG